MSKFGAAVAAGGRNGFGPALQKCNDAGSPVPWLFSVDQNLWDDVQRYSPSTVLVFRTQPYVDGDNRDNPPTMYQGDPVATANDWYVLCRKKWVLNPAHYYAPSNERNPNSAAQDAWLDAFDLRLMQLADADGIKLALHGDSQGEPTDLSRWNNYRASLTYAAQHGHIITLHEDYQAAGNALRYRNVHSVINSFAPGLKIGISECYGNIGADPTLYVKSFYAYDAEAMKDAYLIGFAAYQIGGAENWANGIPTWAEYVASHPTPVIVPEPIGYTFSHFLIDGVKNVNKRIVFAMPDHDVEIVAVFEQNGVPVVYRTITVKTTPAGYEAQITQTPAGSQIAVGAEVVIEVKA